MVSSGIETVCCIVMASCYEKSNNFYSVVVTKEIGLKHVSSFDRLFCAEHFA